MQLTQTNLDNHGALFAILPDGRGIGAETCESHDDVELPLYTIRGNTWERIDNEFFGGSPYANVADIVTSLPWLFRLDWQKIDEIDFL